MDAALITIWMLLVLPVLVIATGLAASMALERLISRLGACDSESVGTEKGGGSGG